jgi:hypothetical protein
VSALAWANNGGKDSSDFHGSLDDVVDALAIVSHNSFVVSECRFRLTSGKVKCSLTSLGSLAGEIRANKG